MLQVSYSHEWLVEVVQLQNAGQQEEAGDKNTGEEFGESKCLETNCCKPVNGKKRQLNNHYFTCNEILLIFKHTVYS